MAANFSLLAASILFVDIISGRADHHDTNRHILRSISDEQLAARINNSSEDSKVAYIVELRRRFDAYAARNNWNEDISSTVFIKIYESTNNGTFYRGGKSLWFWIAKIKRNVAIDIVRKNINRLEAEKEYVLENQIRDQEKASVDEETKRAYQIIDTMGKEFSETARLVYGLGLTHAEAAKKLGVAAGTVSWRINRMKKELSSKNCWPTFVEINPKPSAP